MHQSLIILLQAAADSLPIPANIFTVGGSLVTLAGVIGFLFKLFADSQEKRLKETREYFEAQIVLLRKDLDEERSARRALQLQVNESLTGQLGKNNLLLEAVERLLDKK